jgi:ATP-dependent exoDNAse (exonuclease V) alpha subunit
MLLSLEQETAVSAVRHAAAHPRRFVVVKGPAGSGKTTLLRATFATLGTAARAVTPTGRAALRVAEQTGWPCSTIHRVMYVADEVNKRLVFRRRTDDELQQAMSGAKVLVIDEASMVSRSVWQDIEHVVEVTGVSVALVGDGFQLPPVEMDTEQPFSVFEPGAVDGVVVELSSVHRQAADSPILAAATRLRSCANLGEASVVLEDLPRIPYASVPGRSAADRDARIQSAVIAHRNDTRAKLNAAVRRAMGRPPMTPLQRGEPLLVRRNNYPVGVMNGEVVACEPSSISRDGEYLAVTMRGVECAVHDAKARLCADDDSRALVKAGLPYVRAHLGYVLTAHSAQGSEFDEVYVMLEQSLQRMPPQDQVRWLYTAITRARKRVWIAA